MNNNYHTVLFPYAAIVFGKALVSNLEATFEYILEPDGRQFIVFESVLSKDEGYEELDMSFLVDDYESESYTIICEGILGNPNYWDINEKWW